MDPKALSNMDPKLRETYERVMGTAVATAQAPSSNTIPSPGPAVSSQIPTNLNNASIPTPLANGIPQTQTQLSTPPLSPVTPVTPIPPGANPQNFSAGTFQPLASPASVAQGIEQPGASPLLRILYIAGGAVFFILYAYFWIRIFGVRLPF